MRLKDKMDLMERELAELRFELSCARSNTASVPPEKALVTKRSLYEMVIFEEDLGSK